MHKKPIEGERLYITLTPEQTQRINDYIIAVANKQGKVPKWIKTKIGRKAIDEWLEKHGKDYDIDFERFA